MLDKTLTRLGLYNPALRRPKLIWKYRKMVFGLWNLKRKGLI